MLFSLGGHVRSMPGFETSSKSLAKEISQLLMTRSLLKEQRPRHFVWYRAQSYRKSAGGGFRQAGTPWNGYVAPEKSISFPGLNFSVCRVRVIGELTRLAPSSSERQRSWELWGPESQLSCGPAGPEWSGAQACHVEYSLSPHKRVLVRKEVWFRK